MASTFEVQHVPCVLSLINKGLMHADDLVKHGSLRLVSESLNLLRYVTEAISGMVSTIKCEIDIGIHWLNKRKRKNERFPRIKLFHCNRCIPGRSGCSVSLVDQVLLKQSYPWPLFLLSVSTAFPDYKCVTLLPPIHLYYCWYIYRQWGKNVLDSCGSLWGRNVEQRWWPWAAC
jgi:hypothetical protein